MRTLPLLLVLAAASCALSPQDTPGTSARPSGGFAVQLSSRLNASSQSDLDQQLTAAFTEGTAHPANVRNCVEMLALGARGAGSTADPEYLQQRSTLVQCTVLQALRGAKPASSSFVAALKWDESILPLLPPQPLARARVRALTQAIVSDIHPINNLRVLRYLEEKLDLDKQTRDAWYRHWVSVGFDALERWLVRDAATGRFCHGNSPTMADLCLVPQVFNARRFSVDMNSFPRISAIDAACRQLPAFQTAAPEAPP